MTGAPADGRGAAPADDAVSPIAVMLADAEAGLIAACALTPSALPPDLAHVDGTWRGAPARLTARAYRGPAVAYARFVTLTGQGLDIANVLVFGEPSRALPILGVDLVALGRDALVAVADLSPVPGSAATSDFSAADPRRAALPPRGPLPAWAARWFSPDALVVRVPAREAPRVAPVIASAWQAWAALARTAAPRPARAAAVAAAHDAYCADHRAHDRGLQLLHKIVAPADRFLREVMFPSCA